jgi:hypothetical protein
MMNCPRQRTLLLKEVEKDRVVKEEVDLDFMRRTK